ncbi:hypothetical protein ABPG75_010804 [Micractinium tetrahymenae]
MSAPELALERLQRARARLAAAGGSSPELDWQIQSQQALLAARPELEAAAAALGPSRPVNPEEVPRFPSSPELFKGLVYLLQVGARGIDSCAGISPSVNLGELLNSSCLQARTSAAQPGSSAACAGAVPATPLGHAVAADLARHCPGTTFADLLRWAQTLLLSASGVLLSPGSVRQQQQLLCHSQVLLGSPAAGNGAMAAMFAAHLIRASADWAGMGDARQQQRQQQQQSRAGARQAPQQRQRRGRAEAEDDAPSQGAPAWLLARLRQLAQHAQHALQQASAARWVPREMRKQWEKNVKKLECDIQILSGAHAMSGGAQWGSTHHRLQLNYHAAPAAAPCHCKDCQTKHWKAGHRAECKRLAAERACS